MNLNDELWRTAKNNALDCALLVSQSIKLPEKKAFVQALLSEEYRQQGQEAKARQICSQKIRLSTNCNGLVENQELDKLASLLAAGQFSEAIEQTRAYFDPFLKSQALLHIHRYAQKNNFSPELDKLVAEHLTILQALQRQQYQLLSMRSAQKYFSLGLNLGVLLFFFFFLYLFWR